MILTLASIASATIALKASVKLIRLFLNKAVKLTKNKIIKIVTPILGPAIKAILGFTVATGVQLATLVIDLFFNMSLGYAIALTIYKLIPASRKVLTK